MYSNAEDALASVDRAAARMQEQAAKARAFADEVSRLQVVGQSRDGAAEVTVGHNGALKDLDLGRSLDDASLEQIRAAVLEANADAHRQVVDRVGELSAAAFGADSATSRELVGQYADMFPAPPDEPGARSSAGVLS